MRLRRTIRGAGVLAWVAVLQAGCCPQDGEVFSRDIPDVWQGPVNGGGSSCALATTDDMDGDGIRELLIGASAYVHDDGSGAVIGAVHVVSGVGRGVYTVDEGIARIEGAQEVGDFTPFGCDGLVGGDFNGDGVGDVAFGIQIDQVRAEDDNWIGAVYVYHGPLSGVYSLADADARLRSSDEIHDAIASGDFNGDGVDDLLVPVVYANVSEVDSGAAYVALGPISGDHRLD
ncbi:hypothetical protein L6R50_25210, partial [Myxococcota bacterium]|nr:hypothetical protein [Myxococcota bacterium]